MEKLMRKETDWYAKRFYEKLKKEGYNLVGDTQYINSATHVRIKCPKGHVYKVRPACFNQGRRCRFCYQEEKRKKHARKFYELLHKEGYELVKGERYVKATKPVKVICDRGHKVYITPNNFMNTDNRCIECGHINRANLQRKTHEQFEKEVYELVSDEYTILSKYKNTHEYIQIRHNECGNVYLVTPSKFLTGRRCPHCRGYYKTSEQFKKEIYNLVGNEYSLQSEYVNATTKIRIKHKNCNNQFWTTPNNFLNGNRCPRCNQSKGEKLVESILKENNFTYIHQDKFEECKNKLPLPFDFGVYDNDELIALIEYQGEQHYKPIEFFGGEDRFRYRQYNDNIKREFCKDNNIPLIEIKYSLTDDEVREFFIGRIR